MQFIFESDPAPELTRSEFVSRRLYAIAISLGLHLALIAGSLLLEWATAGSRPVYHVVRHLDLRKQAPLIYYSAVKKKTPQISPSAAPKSQSMGKSPKKLTIRTFNSNRPVPQIVWRPLSVPELPKPVEAPNLAVMSTIPKEIVAAPPPRRAVKTFKAPERKRANVPETALFSDTPLLTLDPTTPSAKLTVPVASSGSTGRIDAAAPPAPKPPPPPTSRQVTASVILDQTGGVAAVVAGENPSASLRDPLSGKRSGIVSTGGAPGVSKPTGGPGIVAPGVQVDSGAGKIVVPSLKTPTEPELLAQPIFRRAGLAAPLRPTSRTLPPAVEGQFRSRTVYTCLVDRGSDLFARDWVIWFAEQQSAESVDTPYMRPPAPGGRPEIAIGPAAGAPPSGSLYFIASITKEGRLERLVALADPNSPWVLLFTQALAKWRFLPALRAQLAVAIDVVIEVPFAATRATARAND
jgi:hypothetical protein